MSSEGKPEGGKVPQPRVRSRRVPVGDPRAVERGRLGGLTRAANTTFEQRSEQAKRAQVSRAILIGLGK